MALTSTPATSQAKHSVDSIEAGVVVGPGQVSVNTWVSNINQDWAPGRARCGRRRGVPVIGGKHLHTGEREW